MMRLASKKIFLLFALPIIIVIIGGLVVDRLAPLDLWGTCKSVVKHIIGILSARLELRVWKIMCIFLAGPILLVLYRFLKSSKYYTSDTIDGIYWEWGPPVYTDSDRQLTARCPKCMYELQRPRKNDLRPKNLAADYIPVCTLHCENCNFKKSFPYRHDILLQKMSKEIDRRILLRQHPFRRLCLLLKGQKSQSG